MSLIRLVTFDVTDTLLKPTHPAGWQYAAAAAKYFNAKYDPALLEKNFRESMKSQAKLYPLYGAGQNVTTKQWWHGVFSNSFLKTGRELARQNDWKIPYTNAQLDKAFEDVYYNFKWSLCPNVKETLQTLKVTRATAGDTMKLGVITNSDDRTSTVLSDLGIGIYFDLIVTAPEAKCQKPSPDMFRFAHKRSGLEGLASQQTLHVGNSFEGDYCGAINAGLQALLLRDNTDATGLPGMNENHIIYDLSQVVDFVKNAEKAD